MDNHPLERATQQIGKQIFEKLHTVKPAFWEAQWWERETVRWLVSDRDARSAILRFIDLFPVLKTDRAITISLREYLPKKSDRLPTTLRLGRAVVESALYTPKAVSIATRLAVGKIAERFIAGATMEETSKALRAILDNGKEYTLDLLGEAILSDTQADDYANEYLNMIEKVEAAQRNDDPKVNVSLKLSSLAPRFSPVSQEYSSAEAVRRIKPIIRRAIRSGASVTIDMENYEIRDLALNVFRLLLEDDQLEKWDGLGVVAQAYLKDAEESLDNLLTLIRNSRRHVTIRLVKGAYWDTEIITAKNNNWPVPVYTKKYDTDACFERMTRTLLTNSDIVTSAIASHNIRSIAKAVAIADKLATPKSKFEIQMLYGMADPIKKVLVDMGIRVREYAPFGETLPGMAYLVRRMLENSSNESFLRRSFLEDEPMDELLENPAIKHSGTRTKGLSADGETDLGNADVFINEPAPAFHKPAVRLAMDKAIENVRAKLGKKHPLLIGGNRVDSNETIISTDPSEPTRVIGETASAATQLAGEALGEARSALKSWAGISSVERRVILHRTAEIIRNRKYELCALEMFEVGKTRSEAIGDLDEAIDHIEFYSRSAVSMEQAGGSNDILGETNRLTRRPRGAGVIISPWNFPLAILAGMTCAALSAGNTVVIKPSSNSPVTAALFADILHEAGIPAGVVNFIPGSGRELGPYLVSHPLTSFVMFTGSWEVGSSIIALAGQNNNRREGFVKVIAEMGGKNGIVIDSTADLDEAVSGVIASAFGYGGQKCSACSRVIVLDDLYDSFVSRLIPAVESLVIGSPIDPKTDYGPLIDSSAKSKSERYIKIGRAEAKTLFIGANPKGSGHFVAPAVFGDVSPASKLATDEIFGPVLSIIRANDLSKAIEIANCVPYALTCGIYSRSIVSVKLFTGGIEAGNIYVNRKITGAIVGRQPFGGFKRSGTGSAKAGSAELLEELSVPICVTENIVRHGFSPDIDS